MGLCRRCPTVSGGKTYISGLDEYHRNKKKLWEEFVRCQSLYGEVCEAYFEKKKNTKTESVFSEIHMIWKGSVRLLVG